MKTVKLSFFAVVLFLFACKKEPSIDKSNVPPAAATLPPLTHTGANTFGCYIDGVPFVANNGTSPWSMPAVSGSFDGEPFVMTIQASRELKRDEKSLVTDILIFRVKTDECNKLNPLIFETSHFKCYKSFGLDKCDYYHDLLNRGTCEITFFDMDKQIISGRFQMTLINKKCEGDTLMKITDGRFDLNF